MIFRSLKPLVGLCLLLPGVFPGGAQAKAPERAIPFQEALVTTSAGDVFALRWRAPGVARVTVFAGTDPQHIDMTHAVAEGSGAGQAMVTNLAPAARWYFLLTPDRGEPLLVADRSLHIPSAANFRDAGGYRTRSGQWVRMGVIYRSNALERLSGADEETVASLHLKLIADLRTDEERRARPDRVPEGVADVQADVLRDDAGEIHLMLTNPTAFAAQMQHSDLRQTYREFVDLPSARQAYHDLFRRLADAGDSPSVFHCTAGKDRTGWAAAVLLTILGVPKQTIFADYELTNDYLPPRPTLQRPNAERSATQPRRPLADPGDLSAAFDEVNRRYGSFERYLRDGLGLTKADISTLRRSFLVG